MPGKFSAGEGWFSLQHDLTDDELKRFVDFDVFYDPMPWFGLIPQWTLLAAIGAIVGAMIGLGRPGSTLGLVLRASLMSAGFLLLLDLVARGSRAHARRLGLCDNRVVCIFHWGLQVVIPGAGNATLKTIGPQSLSWRRIRRISSDARDLTFWMRPTALDFEGRSRIVVPFRAFATAHEARAFEDAARRWHAAATGGDPHEWDEPA